MFGGGMGVSGTGDGRKNEALEILVVDDEKSIRDSLKTYLGHCGYAVRICSDGESGLEAFEENPSPIVLTDLMMPGISGEELLQEVKKKDPLTEVILMTGYGTIDSAVSAIKSGAYDYVIKPFKMENLLHTIEKAARHRNLVRENRRLQENSLNVLRAMVNVLEHRDAYTAGHSQRVTEIALAIAADLGLPDEEREILVLAGPIHDLGKIGIDDSILRKPGKLDADEYDIITSHPEKGIRIIEPLDFLRETIPIILHHHERYDGSGYPHRLRGDNIPMGARIMSVADTFDAMTSSRAYRSARSPEEAYAELRRCSGTQFDPGVVDLFLELAESGTFGNGDTREGGGPAPADNLERSLRFP
jgi:response regulator RpfG family c-di-GMP phosphodiesterase